MLIQKGFLLRSLGNITNQAKNRLFASISLPASETLQRSRLFNILLLVELSLFLVGLPTTFLLNDDTSLFSTTIVLFAGAALAYAVAKSDRYNLAAWVNLGGVLLGLLYYNLHRGPEPVLSAYLNFRASSLLVILPVLLGGSVVSTGECLALTGVALAALLALGLGTVPFDLQVAPDQLTFYSQLFQAPFALIIVVCLSTLVFEGNVLKLCARLCKRNHHYKEVAARLKDEVGNAGKVLQSIDEALANLEKVFEEQLTLAGLQQTVTLEIKEWQARLKQSNNQLVFLLGQASGVISDSQAIVTQRGELIRTISAVYNRLQQLLELISHSVEVLGLAAVQIEQVVGSISEVAEETNLLALNASIEAAGHLEQGRRFTMVASEVYRLASRSRDAAEEVRQVANEIQGSVISLAKASSRGRDLAEELAQTAISAPASVDQLAALMETLARNSARVFGNVQKLQNNLNALLDELTEATTNEPPSNSARNLIESSRVLRQGLSGLEDAGAPGTVSSLAGENVLPPAANGDYKPGAESGESFFLQKLYLNRVKTIAPGLPGYTAWRRQIRLLNKLYLGYCLFLAGYFGLSLFTGFEIISILPTAFFLVLLLVVYSLNKTGSATYALVGFFAANYLFYTVLLISQKDQFGTVDATLVGSNIFCITILVAVIVADLGWIFYITVISMAWTAALAFLFITASFSDILGTLVYPLSLQAAIGVLGGFLFFNVNRLSAYAEEQNREIALAYRKAQLKKRRIAALSKQFTARFVEIRQLFESQTRYSSLQFEDLMAISAKIEVQSQVTAGQSGSLRQVGQAVTHALDQVKAVVRESDEGERILAEFQGGVGEIAANSESLKIHAGEIGQIFELITTVADEIDLVALNATLEAAQAREAGKRFGAVAGEIQRLAGRARQTGVKVQSVISNVQEAVSLCAQLTERGLNELSVLTQSASETTLSARTVIEVVGAGQKMVGQLDAASREQAELLGQLNRQLQHINFNLIHFRPRIEAGFEYIEKLQELAGKLGQASQSPRITVPAELSPVEELV